MVKLILIGATICILSATLSETAFNNAEALKEFMTKMEGCKAEVGASDSDIDDMVKQVAASSKEGKCLRACLMKTYGLLDNNGKFVESVAVKHVEDYTNGNSAKLKTAKEIIDACVGIVVSEDHCDAAETYGTCFVEQGKAHGLEKFKFEGL